MSLARRAGRNMAFKALGEASRFAWALLLILVARRLGGESLGRISFAYSFTYLFVLLLDLGLNVLVVREVARDKGAAGRYLGTLLSFKLLSAPVAFGMIAAAIILSGYPSDVVTVVLLFASVLVLVVGSLMARRSIPHFRLFWDPALWLTLLRRAIPVGMTVMFIVLYNESDIVLLSYLGQGERGVGWYAAASKIMKMLQLLPMLVVGGVYPVFSDLARGPQEALSTAYRGTLKLLLMIAIPVATVVAGLAEPLIRLVYGPGFSPAIVPLRLLACSIPFMYLGHALVNVLVSSDRTRWAALATGVAGAISIAGNLLLIPTFGIAGSALAAIAAQVGLVVVGAVAVEWAVTRSRWVQVASKPAVAGAAMFVTVALVGPTSWAVAFPAGLGIYLLGLLVTGALREKEFMAVRRLWRGTEPNRVLKR